jgi:hypothetical protein
MPFLTNLPCKFMCRNVLSLQERQENNKQNINRMLEASPELTDGLMAIVTAKTRLVQQIDTEGLGNALQMGHERPAKNSV